MHQDDIAGFDVSMKSWMAWVVHMEEVHSSGDSPLSDLSGVIGVKDATHRGMISSTLHSLNSKSCLHLCVEKWDGQYVCNQCYKYFNYDDGREVSKG